MKIYHLLISIILLNFVFLAVSGQDNKQGTGISPSGFNYVEKTSLFTDRNIYMAGERIWFSALLYCHQGDDKTCLSNILYVDLYDESAPYTLQQKFRIINGKVSGSLIIPDDFITGNYFIRAYTNYQKSSLAVDLTKINLLILNPNQKKNTPTEEKAVQLFFNNGNPVYTIPAKGVVATGIPGKTITNAVVLNGRKDTVCRVNRIKDNLGTFEFTPEENKSYGLSIRFADKDSLFVPIDNIQKSGWNLTAHLQDDYPQIIIEPVNQKEAASCVLTLKNSQMKTLFRKEFSVNGSPYYLNIARRYISSGINYLVLTDEKGKLLYLKAVNGQTANPVRLEIHTNADRYKPGENVSLTINGFSGNISENASIVVSAGLKGTYTNDEFNSFDTRLSHALLLIRENEILQNQFMLDKLLSDKSLSVDDLPDVRDVSLTGKVTDNSGNPVAGAEVYLAVPGDQPQLHIYNSKKDGSFVFSLNNFHGNKRIFAGSSGKGSVKIKINSDFAPQLYPAWNELSFQKNDNSLYEKLYINQQVANRFLSDSVFQSSDGYLPQPLFSKPDHTITLSDFIPLSSLEEDFKEIVQNTRVYKRKGEYHFQVITPEPSRTLDDPLVMLDNIPVFNYEQLLQIPPASVEKINVINQEYFLGTHMLNGVINVISKKSSLENYNFPAGTIFFNYQTITPSTKFEIPKMVAKQVKPRALPYFANLLYWNAGITLTDKPVQLEFSTGDNEGNYEIQVRGITSDGRPVSGSVTIDVHR